MRDDDGTEMVRCRCDNGRLVVECCRCSYGSGGGGEPVDTGECRICGGVGWRRVDADTSANTVFVRRLAEWGGGYLGSGTR